MPLQVLGDSKMIVDWATGRSDIHVINLAHWCQRIEDRISSFELITFPHIFRELNYIVDTLSKKVIRLEEGLLYFEELKENVRVTSCTLSMI